MQKKLGELYQIIYECILRKSEPQFVLSRKDIFFILGTLFHVPKECRDKVFKELLSHGYLEEVCKGSFRVLNNRE